MGMATRSAYDVYQFQFRRVRSILSFKDVVNVSPFDRFCVFAFASFSSFFFFVIIKQLTLTGSTDHDTSFFNMLFTSSHVSLFYHLDLSTLVLVLFKGLSLLYSPTSRSLKLLSRDYGFVFFQLLITSG